MESIIEKLQVTEKLKFSIRDYDANFTGDYDKDEADAVLNQYKEELRDLQEKFYAAGNYSLLIVLQAMDAAGKDSTIKHVMSGINPQGCYVSSFKQPSMEELRHDFLWRHHEAMPARGFIGIHNRSHYESVLVCKVHPELVLNEKIGGYTDLKEIDKKFWKNRYESIRDFEKHLYRNGTVILKFFLNISKEEQKERFIKRIDDPTKNWKFSAGDLEERKRWDDYMAAYQEAIEETSTKHAPWFIIPGNKKWFARIAIIQIIIDAIKNLNIKDEVRACKPDINLQQYKQELLDEDS